MLSGRAAFRGLVGFLLALAIWFGFSRPYEKTIAAASEALCNVFESPDVTRLDAKGGEILLDRRDFPPGSARPGLSGPDIHFNFVLLVALFALDPRPLRGAHFSRFLAAAAALWLVHVARPRLPGSLASTPRASARGAPANYGRVAPQFLGGGMALLPDRRALRGAVRALVVLRSPRRGSRAREIARAEEKAEGRDQPQ